MLPVREADPGVAPGDPVVAERQVALVKAADDERVARHMRLHALACGKINQ